MEKTLGPPRRSAASVAKEAGVSKSALSKWIKAAMGENGAGEKVYGKNSDKQVLSPEEKIEVLMKAASLAPEELGGFLRGRGLYESHLEAFRAEAVLGLSVGTHDVSLKAELNRGRQKIIELERELRRKDKALAETAALLVLQKKSQQLWGDEGSSTNKKNG